MPKAKHPAKTIEAIRHRKASRKHIPTAEYQTLMAEDERNPIEVAYERRNRDLDPQLVWRGKDEQHWSDLVVQAPPLYIQEKVSSQALIEDLRQHSEEAQGGSGGAGIQIPFRGEDFNGLPSAAARTEFYQHDANWSNRMILGDSLRVMASLAEREGLRGKVQCIYIDPPYGIKFNSNFQWSTTSRDVRDGKAEHITREPEQVKAFRDTWRYGIHSYLTYLRDRLTVARDLLTESGSVFVQMGDENVHLVRALMNEVFGEENSFAVIIFKKKSFTIPGHAINDYILHYTKNRANAKLRTLYGKITTNDLNPDDSTFNRILTVQGDLVTPKSSSEASSLLAEGGKWCQSGSQRLISQHTSPTRSEAITLRNRKISLGSNAQWAFDPIESLPRLEKAGRLHVTDRGTLIASVLWSDIPRRRINNLWDDTTGEPQPRFVVQTSNKVIQRCVLMTTDPGDLVLDPTCGSGTSAYVAEQWGRRWITIDTSRVALALARARIMGARYPYYLLADSPSGQKKEAEISGKAPLEAPTYDDIRQGFVYERVPHITLKSIANNSAIDVIWEEFQERLEPLRAELNAALGTSFEEWEIPRDFDEAWSEKVRGMHAAWRQQRLARQQEIDASIAARADYETLYDKPYEDNKKVRVAGPFTVESLSPHRTLTVDENDELLDKAAEASPGYAPPPPPPHHDFAAVILDNVRTCGVQQAHKEDRISFSGISLWPGYHVCAEGTFIEGDADSGAEKRAAIFIGPEFATVSRPDLVEAAREAAEAGFDVLIAFAFNYEAHASDFNQLGRIPILKARINADLHMAGDLKNTGKGNLFVIFGEPDIDILDTENGQIQVKIKGVDVFHPNSGEIRSDDADGIACWFVDTDYNEESFFVRQAYFLGADDPYKKLKKTLRAEINEEAWETLNSDTSRPFAKPASGRIAVKVINHLGDEVMKVFRVEPA